MLSAVISDVKFNVDKISLPVVQVFIILLQIILLKINNFFLR